MPAFRLASALGLVALLWGARAASQPTEGAPPAEPSAPVAAPAPAAAPGSAESACYPACREGFTCHQGQCVSLCNPPCPEGLECVEGKRCEPPLPGGRSPKVYEPPAPAVKPFERRNHALLGLHLGFPGPFERDGQEGDLGTTVGFNLRGDSPVASYVLLGPMLQLGAWSPDITPEPSNSYYLDLDFVLRFRAPLTTSKFNYQIWLGMPVGLTVNILGDHPPDVSGVGLGWNIGVLFGGAAHFSPKFGLFAEVGWLQHKFSHDGEVGPDYDFTLQQACLNLGIVLRN